MRYKVTAGVATNSGHNLFCTLIYIAAAQRMQNAVNLRSFGPDSRSLVVTIIAIFKTAKVLAVLIGCAVGNKDNSSRTASFFIFPHKLQSLIQAQGNIG